MLNSALLGAVLFCTFVPAVVGQSPVYGQCGGMGWTGPSTCTSGNCCTFSNDWYSQCLPGSNCGGNPPVTTTTTKAAAVTTTSSTRTSQGGTSSTSSASIPGTGSAGCTKNPTLTSGIKQITINGKTRQYTLRVPDNYNSNTQYKLVFGLHWLNGNMGDVVSAGYYGLLPLSNNQVIFVAPDGLNAGWANNGGEDIEFIDALVALIQGGLCVNTKLIFSTGFSYGAAMTFSIACSRANVFRAVAVISGAQLSGCSGGTTPIPYLGIHGVADTVLNISLGRSLRDKYLGLDRCTNQVAQEPAAGSGKHIKTSYSGCTPGFPVTWIAHDGGHVPNPHDSNGVYWAPGETWSFFSQFF